MYTNTLASTKGNTADKLVLGGIPVHTECSDALSRRTSFNRGLFCCVAFKCSHNSVKSEVGCPNSIGAFRVPRTFERCMSDFVRA